MATFRRTMANYDLIDMGFVGSRFTWSNKRKAIKKLRWRKITKQFRFEECWHENPRCGELIQQSWSKPSTGSALQQAALKIQDTGNTLMQWYSSKLNNQNAEMRIIQEKLNDLMRRPYSLEQYEEQRLLHVKHNQLLAQQEKRATNRKSKNLIRGLIDEQGQWQVEPNEIQRLLLSYFKKVFSTESTNLEAIEAIVQATPTKVSSEMNESLMQQYSDEEIKTALFQMHPSKSPGPDEGLSAFITNAMQCNLIQGMKMCPHAPTLHHLFFADDSLLFGTATTAECLAFKHILNVYKQASRQKVHFQKSIMVFSKNVDIDLQNSLASILEVERKAEHDKHLGLPLRVGKFKTEKFAYIKERLPKKLISWMSKILSCAGKEILIKAVAQTMPLYAMNCYLLPKNLCDDIHQLCASFFWGDTDEKKKIHWRSWERLCLTKQEGGMGLKNIYAYNLAMLAKQG
ncbi:uncharacterized protein LOC112178251 [Rosa chinensis]|uniref:uncharacterized protein LOC112178251 n=1 Tax=Rosa chinensis TaxID=74649 RepID=UPI000D08FC95|nr:uncharacterized protein LOC112178251 [Rosa chinensis]